MTTQRVNLRESDYDVYVGRAPAPRGNADTTIWGNPFVVGRDGTRAEVVERYEHYVLSSPALMARIGDLVDKRLGCWCRVGDPCHGDVLVRLAERHKRPSFPLGGARQLARAIVADLEPVTQRVMIAGSIRRAKRRVKDIEIVAVPRIDPGQRDMFGEVVTEINRLDQLVADRVAGGRWGHRFDAAGRIAHGERYKRLRHYGEPLSGIGIDLFSVLPPAQWGVIAAIRTGPAEFSQRLVTPASRGGLLPENMRVIDGAIWETTSVGAPLHVIPTETEEELFDVLGLPWIAPEERR